MGSSTGRDRDLDGAPRNAAESGSPPDLPPRWSERLLERLIGAGPSVDFVLGDLREEYATRSERGRWRAARWHGLQVLEIGVRMRWERWRQRRQAVVRRTVDRPKSKPGDAMRIETRQAVRFLVRRPGFSGAVVLTVAVAIAATTTVFAVVDGVLLERMPYDDADGIVVVWERNIPRDQPDNVASPANFLAWADRTRTMEALAAAVATSTTLTGEGEPERIGMVVASPALFDIVRATPLIGRLLIEADAPAGADRVVVLSEGYWRRRFGGDPDISGRSVTLNGTPYTVVGVLPARYDVPIAAEFNGTGTHDVWITPGWDASARTATGRYLQVFGRLANGASVEAARQEMEGIAAQLLEEYPQRQAGWSANVVSLRDQVVGQAGRMVWVVFGAVCLVLLIACGNVANLLLTRATARQEELAVRAALGAGRGRLARQLLLESGLLAMAGGAIGLVLAFWAVRAVVAMAPDLPRVDTLGLDGSVIGFAFGATLATTLAFGLIPAVHVAGADVAVWLRDRGSGAAGRRGARLRAGLVVAQVAMSLILLVGAGLLIRSFANRLAVGIGFAPESLVTAELSLAGDRYADTETQARFFEQLVDEARALPSVRAASAITFAPLTGLGSATSFWPTDRPVPPPDEQPVADVRWVHRDFHDVIGLPLREGRFFEASDDAGAPLRVLVNEAGARALWPGESAVGKRIAMPWGDTLVAEVVGVVGDMRFNGPATELRPMLYWEHRQFRSFQQMTLILRTAGDPAAPVAGLRDVVHRLDPDLPVFNVTTMDALYSRALARPRFATTSLAGFAALALLLAAIGIYGVISYATQQRSREIGIRMALGADRRRVVKLVLAQGAALIGIAIVLGAAGAFALGGMLEGLMFEMSPTDPRTFVAVTALLAAVALLACWLPARRASGMDPANVLR